MPAVWDEAMQKQLLLSVVHLAPPAAPDWDKVAAIVGGAVNANGCLQKYNKMRRECKEEFNRLAGVSDSASADAGTAAPKTPSKRTPGKKAAGEASAKSTGKRKASKADVEDGEADGDDDESPTKKLKAEADADEFD